MVVGSVDLLLVRHGEAERDAESDALRVLSMRGRADVEATAARLVSLRIQKPRVYTSSLVRARQTADILSRALGVDPPLMLEGMAPDDDPQRAAIKLAELCVPGMTPVVATHMPLIAGLITWLEEGSLQHPVPVATAGAVFLKGEVVGAGLMRPVWRWPPAGG